MVEKEEKSTVNSGEDGERIQKIVENIWKGKYRRWG